jgi:hypothetical protein
MRYKRGDGRVKRIRKAYPSCGKTCHARADDGDAHRGTMHDDVDLPRSLTVRYDGACKTTP